MAVRSLTLRVAWSAVLLLQGVAWAQTHRVEKPKKVTRAIAVYEWTGDLTKPTASRLVPVSLFIDGELEDAGVYLARPVPFALDSGYVYSIEKAGEPLGVLEVDGARNVVTRRSAEDDNPISAWFGYGRYIPPAAVAKAPALRTSAHPGVIVASNTNGRPHFSSRSADGTAKGEDQPVNTGGKTASGPAPAKGEGASTPATTRGGEPDATPDDDRPHMSRRSESPATDAPATTAGTTPDAAGDDSSDRPTLRRRDAKTDDKAEAKRRAKESGAGVRSMATSLNDDPDRPTLHRGTEEVPTGTPPLSGNPPGMQQSVAVSDPNVVDNHPFARPWQSAEERAATLASFQALARPRIANYLALNQLQPGTALTKSTGPAAPAAEQHSVAKPADSAPAGAEDTGGAPRLQRGRPAQTATQTPAPPPAVNSLDSVPTAAAAAHPSAAQASAVRHHSPSPARTAGHRTKGRATAALPLLLNDEKLVGFELSYGGLPTFVYTATTPTSSGSAVHLTLIGQLLPTGELQVALSSVTDDAHLDRAPSMRLVDAVDPNDSHRASFLFELRAKASRQFALYRLLSAHAERSFITGIMQ